MIENLEIIRSNEIFDLLADAYIDLVQVPSLDKHNSQSAFGNYPNCGITTTINADYMSKGAKSWQNDIE